jgi:transcription elongation factor GreA
MTTSTYPITKNGAEKLKAELINLKTRERPAVINAISEARAQGDLSENADYDAAPSFPSISLMRPSIKP